MSGKSGETAIEAEERIQEERMKSMRRTKAELQETVKVENVKSEIIGEKRYVHL